MQRSLRRRARGVTLRSTPLSRAPSPVARDPTTLLSLIALALMPLDRAAALLDRLITFRPWIFSAQVYSLSEASSLGMCPGVGLRQPADKTAAQVHVRLRQATQSPREFRQSRLAVKDSIQERSKGYIRSVPGALLYNFYSVDRLADSGTLSGSSSYVVSSHEGVRNSQISE